VDESKKISELVREVGTKLGIKNPEEFSFQTEGEGGPYWLNAKETLPEQNIDTLISTLLLKPKYFVKDAPLSDLTSKEEINACFCRVRNPSLTLYILQVLFLCSVLTQFHLFMQALDAIVSGIVPCTIDDAIQFAAFQCQIRFGDCTINQDSWEELW
jgi:hypothetical protein